MEKEAWPWSLQAWRRHRWMSRQDLLNAAAAFFLVVAWPPTERGLVSEMVILAPTVRSLERTRLHRLQMSPLDPSPGAGGLLRKALRASASQSSRPVLFLATSSSWLRAIAATVSSVLVRYLYAWVTRATSASSSMRGMPRPPS